MVSLMVLSHSKKIADGIKELAEEVSGGSEIYAVGGSKAGTLGSDYDRIQEALLSATDKGDVIVLADMGSSILTVETAIDAMDEERQSRIHLSSAALVEGSVLTAVSISAGLSVDDIFVQLEDLKLEK